jgi:hypothetical protein
VNFAEPVAIVGARILAVSMADRLVTVAPVWQPGVGSFALIRGGNSGEPADALRACLSQFFIVKRPELALD